MDQYRPIDAADSKEPVLRRALAAGARQAQVRIHEMFSSRGPGFRRLAKAHAGSAAADTLVAMALAGTLFFDVPSTEARDNVALYLLITLAPFAVIGPFLGAFYTRFPGAYRGGMVFSSGLRAVLALAMVIWLDGVLLFPLAFLILVLSRLFGISRSSLLPVVLASPRRSDSGQRSGGQGGGARQRARGALWGIGHLAARSVAGLLERP